MFKGVDLVCELIGVVRPINMTGGLKKYIARIELLIHRVYRDAGNRLAGLDDSTVNVFAVKTLAAELW